VNFANSLIAEQQSQIAHCRRRFRDVTDAVDQQHRLALEPEISAVFQQRRDVPGEFCDPARFVELRQQNVAAESIPVSCPRLVRPTDQEREIRAAARHHLVERPLQDAASVEPVIIVAEPAEPEPVRQLCLRFPDLGQAEIVKAEVGRQARLPMPGEQRISAVHIRPFREPFAPPSVVLRYRVKLRQVKSNQIYVRTRTRAREWFRQPGMLHTSHSGCLADQSEHTLHRMAEPAIQYQWFRFKIGQCEPETRQGSQQKRSDPEDRAAWEAAMFHLG